MASIKQNGRMKYVLYTKTVPVRCCRNTSEESRNTVATVKPKCSLANSVDRLSAYSQCLVSHDDLVFLGLQFES